MLYSEQMHQICEKLGVKREDCKDGLYSTLLQAICDACDGGGSGGGGAEIPTCTVRFLPAEESSGFWNTVSPADIINGMYVYTKCENGVISTVVHEGNEIETDYDITLENVVCGSVIFVNTNGNNNTLDGEITEPFAYSGIPGLFIAPETPGAVATAKLGQSDEW